MKLRNLPAYFFNQAAEKDVNAGAISWLVSLHQKIKKRRMQRSFIFEKCGGTISLQSAVSQSDRICLWRCQQMTDGVRRLTRIRRSLADRQDWLKLVLI